MLTWPTYDSQGIISNILEENVLQPLLVSTSAIELATETVGLLLRIECVPSLFLAGDCIESKADIFSCPFLLVVTTTLYVLILSHASPVLNLTIHAAFTDTIEELMTEGKNCCKINPRFWPKPFQLREITISCTLDKHAIITIGNSIPIARYHSFLDWA